MDQPRLARHETDTIIAIPRSMVLRSSLVNRISPMLMGNNIRGNLSCSERKPSEWFSDKKKLAISHIANASMNQRYFRSLNNWSFCLIDPSRSAKRTSNPIRITFKETKKERKKEAMKNRNKLETIISLLFMKMC